MLEGNNLYSSKDVVCPSNVRRFRRGLPRADHAVVRRLSFVRHAGGFLDFRQPQKITDCHESYWFSRCEGPGSTIETRCTDEPRLVCFLVQQCSVQFAHETRTEVA